MDNPNTKEIGNAGEDAALIYLKNVQNIEKARSKLDEITNYCGLINGFICLTSITQNK